MSYKIIVTANANRDIQNAIDWEEERHTGLGGKFYNDLNQRFKDLSLVPGIGSVRYDDVHCVETKIFHYLIHYSKSTNTSNNSITYLAYKTKTIVGINHNPANTLTLPGFQKP